MNCSRNAFKIVERIAHVPPETVKINLQISTMGLQMMGLRDALRMDETLSIPGAHDVERRISPPPRRSARNARD